MKKHPRGGTGTVRRSVALPLRLVEEAARSAPLELRENFNRLVRTAIEQMIVRWKEASFELEMRAMAEDPALRKVSRQIAEEFTSTEEDGLPP